MIRAFGDNFKTDGKKPVSKGKTRPICHLIKRMETTSTNQPTTELTKEPRLWQGDGWTALVIKNEDDDGWAVAMTKDGASEPALVGPWTMGRNKKDPKPLDGFAFSTLVKTAHEFVRRQEQQQHAALHQDITVTAKGQRVTVSLDITPDEDNPYATLTAHDEGGDALGSARVDAGFKLNRASAVAWAESSFAKPKGR
jgi:hypothetical protein